RPDLVLRLGDGLHTVAVAPDGAILLDGDYHDIVHAADGDRHFIRIDGRTIETVLVDPRKALEDASGGANEIRTPMPGAVVSVHKAAGDAVMRGETIITIESMKLQTALGSPRDGIVAEVLKSEGDTFDKDAVIARLVDISEG